jgi:hypothetical protein
LIKRRFIRNPLAAERSPRNDGQKFDTAVPVAPPEQERWKYPETDWGLMAQFSSQKDVYEAIYERERNHYKELQEVIQNYLRLYYFLLNFCLDFPIPGSTGPI